MEKNYSFDYLSVERFPLYIQDENYEVKSIDMVQFSVRLSSSFVIIIHFLTKNVLTF